MTERAKSSTTAAQEKGKEDVDTDAVGSRLANQNLNKHVSFE